MSVVLIDAVLDIIFPYVCIVCGREGEHICKYCRKQLQFELRSLQTHDIWYGCKLSDGWVRSAIHHLKYAGLYGIADVLVTRCRESYVREEFFSALHLQTPLGIVPVPSSIKRYKTRGYNQAEKLATALGRWLSASVYPKALKKKDIKSLVGLNKEGRSVQSRRAYLLGQVLPANVATILLVDDVCTTGSTLQSCREVLTLAYPEAEIVVFAFAYEEQKISLSQTQGL